MSRILLIWELGGNLGHLGGFIPLAQELRRLGHEPILVLRDLSRFASLAQNAGLPLLQAPVWQGVGRSVPPMNYAEILLGYGFMDANGLSCMVNAWRNLFSLTSPHLLIFDHAPTALLASTGMTIPRALFGTGFCSPPRTFPFPPMRKWLQHSLQQLAESEAQVLAAANIALGRHGVAPLDRLTDLFEVEEDFLGTFRELDHYSQRDRNAHYWGTLYAHGGGSEPVWPPGTGKQVFAYLDKNYGDLETVLQILAASSARVLVYAPGIPQQLAIRHQSANMVFLADAVDFGKLGGQCDVGVCHAGHGTVSALLLEGIPLLLLPGQLEQFLLAMNVQNMGAGLVVNPEEPNNNYAALLERLLTEPCFGQSARNFAAKYAQESQQERVNKIARRCEEIIVRSVSQANARKQ